MSKQTGGGTGFCAAQFGDTEWNMPAYWRRFADALDGMGAAQLEIRRREAQRLLRENGVTYNVYSDTQHTVRSWKLDPVPMLLDHGEWAVVEAGIKQRAELLDLILQDIYGEQRLLKKGLLPSELVMTHDGFLHSCVGAYQGGHGRLAVYAANLARGRDGRMWVLDDRSQAPSGSGYALENRTVVSRVVPEIFRDMQVRRLSGFFRHLRKGLAEMAPHNKEDPRIVILTPGSLNETYFEHAYLSSYLGFTLVQGDDLTVRDGRVWLKTLDRLQPVDVILRRVDDSYCDPLELRSISRLGVAGLLQAVRRNRVAVANPLGSSIVENPGLLAFLPQLAKYFLDSDLLLPSIATWWCGQRRERDYVLQNLDRLIIKPISRARGNRAVFGGLLSIKEKDRLRATICANPYAYVGQEYMHFATVPAFVDHRIEPRFALMRSFAVASGGDYQVMPGGLTRIARRQDDLIVSNQAGGVSKDTWVLSEQPDIQTSLWFQPNRDIALCPVSEPLTSRAANNLFWVGRYLERIKAGTRLMRTILLKLNEAREYNDPLNRQCLNVLLCAMTQVTATYPGFMAGEGEALRNPRDELLALAKNVKRTGALAANIQMFAQSAFSIRDLWSQDTWRCIDRIQRRWQQRVVDAPCGLELLQKHLDELSNGFVAFIGLTTESMTRETGWSMLDSGRRLERALALMTLLRATVVRRHEPALQNQLLEAVLLTTDSLSIYRRRYRSFIQLPMVLDLLLMDESHPRSLAYQLHRLSDHIGDLPRERSRGRISEEERLMLKAYSSLRLFKLSEALKPDSEASNYPELDEMLSNTTELLWRLYEAVAQAYFSHSQMPQLITPTRPEEES